MALRVAAAIMIALTAMIHPVTAEEARVALVIGNGAYRNLPVLANPTHDAELIASTLREVGFELVGGGAQVDLDRAAFEHAIRQFGTALQNGAVGLFYYAGHGLQVQGANFLVPTNANPATVADVDFELIDATTVLRRMELAGSKLNIIILDACRNNPFGGRGLRDAARGLAPMQAPRGTVISYATQPGNVAADGTGKDSPYTTALAAIIRRPGLQLWDVFNEVGLEVDRTTGGMQRPYLSVSPVDGTFYFVGPNEVSVKPPAVPVVAAAGADVRLVLDVQGLLKNSKAGKMVREQIEQKRAEYAKQISQREQALREERDALQRQTSALSAQVLSQRSRELQQKVNELDREVQSKRQTLEHSNAEASEKIQQSLLRVATEIAKERKANMVFQRSELVLYDQGLDITDQVLRNLDEQLPTVTVNFSEPAAAADPAQPAPRPEPRQGRK